MRYIFFQHIVQQNKKYGVIDFKNEIIVPFSDEYGEIKIQANIILIKNKHGFNLWGAYTREGNLICEPKYNAIVPISEYALKVSKEEIGYLGGSEKWGIVDFTGKELIPIEYDWISDESDNGLLKIKDFPGGNLTERNVFLAENTDSPHMSPNLI